MENILLIYSHKDYLFGYLKKKNPSGRIEDFEDAIMPYGYNGYQENGQYSYYYDIEQSNSFPNYLNENNYFNFSFISYFLSKACSYKLRTSK